MRGLPFLKYSIMSVVRNRRRSLFAMIGVAIALSLITGSFIAVDSSSLGVLRAATEGVSIDFLAQVNPYQTRVNWSSINNSLDAIEKVQYVDHATPVIISSGFVKRNEATNTTYTSPYDYGLLAMLPRKDARLLEASKINGDMPDPGTVAVPRTVANALDLDVGDVIVCQAKVEVGEYDSEGNFTVTGVYYANLSYPISQIWTQERTSDPYLWYGAITSNDILLIDGINPVVLALEEGQQVFDAVEALPHFGNSVLSNLLYPIWLDRDSVISLADIEGSISRITFAHNRLQMLGQDLGFYVGESNLAGALQIVSPQLTAMKVLFLVLSLPVIALGVYLSLVGVDLGLTGRRREVGVLKSRGASSRQVFGSMILESTILGVTAAVIGLLSGIVISRFLMGSVSSLSEMTSSSVAEWYWTDISISGGTVFLALLFGVLLMLLSTYRPFKRISRTPVAEALHHYSPLSTQTSYRPFLDFFLLGISGLSVACVLVGINGASGHGWSWMTEIILSVIIIMGIVLFPLMPFFLSLGVVRLLTRGSHKLYAKFTALVRPWTKELTYLVDRNIVRNPRRAANLGVIISLALAFGMFISVTMESSIAYEKETVKYGVGSDIRISVYPRTDPEGLINYSRLDTLGSIAGADHVANFYFLGATVYFGYVGVVVLNSSEYLKAVDPGDFYFRGHGKAVLSELEENGTCLVREDFARDNSILEGDQLRMDFKMSAYRNGSYVYFSHEVVVEVIGFVKALPGTGWPTVYIDLASVSFISPATLMSQSGPGGAIIKVSEGADPTEVANAANQVFVSAGLTPSTEILQDKLDELSKDPVYGALTSFLYMEYALAIAIMAVGVGLIIFVAVNDREHELACMMARGSSAGQMRKILMGESMTLMSLGLIVGACVGLLTAYLFNTLFGDQTNAVIERRMVFTWISWLVVAASVISLLVASTLATARAGKIRLTEVLRIRGG